MKIRALVLIGVLLAGGAVAAERYVDAPHGFSLQPPAGWTGSTDTSKLSPGTVLLLAAPDKKSVFTVKVLESTATAAQVEESLYQAAKAKGYQVYERTSVVVAGEPGHALSYRMPEGGVESTAAVTLGNRLYVLQAAATDVGAFQAHRSALAGLVASFAPVVPEAVVEESQDRTQYLREEQRHERLRQERLREERLRQDRLRRQRDGY